MLVCPCSSSGLGLRFRRETNWNKALNGDTVYETSSIVNCVGCEGDVIPHSDRFQAPTLDCTVFVFACVWQITISTQAKLAT